MEDQKIKDYIFQAVQSGKKETSDLAGSILHKMENKIAESVDKTVNGKINNLTQMMNDQNMVIHEHFDKVDAHIEKVETYLSYMEVLKTASDGGKMLGKFVLFVGAVGAAILAIKAWFR